MTGEQSGSGPTRRRRKALFVALGVVVVLGVLELVGWAVWRLRVGRGTRNEILALCGQRSDEPRDLPNTFWHHQRNPRCPRYPDINAKGTRGPDFPMPKPARELRIICVGDSTVAGDGVGTDETFPHYMQQRLAREAKRFGDYDTLRVINAGVGSHNSAFTLAYLALRLIHYGPDIVVIRSSYNDYLPYIVPGMAYDYTHVFPRPFCDHASTNPYWSLARLSYLLKVAGGVAFRDEVVSRSRDRVGHVTSDHRRRMDCSANRDKLFLFGENVRSMILLCRGRGIKVYVVDLPTSPDPAHFEQGKGIPPRFRDVVSLLDGELKRVTSEEKVPLVRSGPLGAGDFLDYCHNTPAGYRKIADRACEIILQGAR